MRIPITWATKLAAQIRGLGRTTTNSGKAPLGTMSLPLAPAKRHNKVVRRLRTLMVAALGCLGILWLVKDPVAKSVARGYLHKEIGVRAQMHGLSLGLASGTLKVDELKLYNPAEFGGSMLCHVPQLSVALDLKQALAGKLRYKEVRLHLAELHVVEGLDGRFNLQLLEKLPRLRKRRHRPHDRDFEFAGIERLCLTLGTVRYTSLKHPEKTRAFSLDVREEVVSGLENEDAVNNWLASFVLKLALQEYLEARGQKPSE